MTRDPFDALEQQLRDSVQGRKRAPALHRRALLALAAVLALGGGVAGAAGILSHDGDDAAVRKALTQGNEAARQLPACAPANRRRPLQIVSGRPSAAVLRQLGIFRRRASAADRVPPRVLTVGFGSVLRESIRVARAVDGTRFVLYISRGVAGSPQRDPVACFRAIRSESIKAASHDNAQVRARVRRITAGWVHRVESVAAGRTESLSMIQLRPDGGLRSGGATYVASGRIPAMGSSGSVRINGRRRIELTGLIPDGVSTVRFLDRGGLPSRRARPVTVRVRDNVYHVLLSRRMGPRITAEWRDVRGHVIRRVHPRR